MLNETSDLVREVLSFQLGREEYAIDIMAVQELRGYESVTRIANSPEYIKGVINLRGVIVPIVDLRIQFGIPDPVYDELTVVVIINISGRTTGIVVDSVSDVVGLSAEQIKSAPDLASLATDGYVMGLATVEDRMLILSDVEKLLASADTSFVQKLAA